MTREMVAGWRLLIVGLAAVALLAAPSPASANDTPIELVDENSGQHCGAAGPSECHLLVASIDPVVVEAFGAHRSTCYTWFELDLDEGGSGQAVGQVMAGGQCVLLPCGSPDPWDILGVSEEDGVLDMRVEFCLSDPLFGEFECVITARVEVQSHTNTLARAALPGSECEGLGGVVHLTARWAAYTEGAQELEVVHT